MDHNKMQMLKAIRKITIALCVLLVVLVLFGSGLGYYIDGITGVFSVLFGTLAVAVLSSMTIFVLKYSLKNPTKAPNVAMIMFLIKFSFALVYLLLLKTFFTLNTHIVFVVLAIGIVIVALAETFALFKTNMRIQSKNDF